MKPSQSFPFISSATRWMTGVTACGLALAACLVLHPVTADAANLQAEFNQGGNTLSFHRGHYYMRGITIRDFTLIPLN
jgi:hypothetical protein